MSAPFRIKPHPNQAGPDPQPNPAKQYIDTLVKLIPAEVVGLYLSGREAIRIRFPPPPEGMPTMPATPAERWAWIIWTVFCLFGVLSVRIVMTSDKPKQVPPEWWAVGIACISYVIWVYSFGDVFDRVIHDYDSLAATLLVFAWTFIVPLIYEYETFVPRARPKRTPALG